MKTAWFKNAKTDQEREEIRAHFVGSARMRQHFKVMLQDKINESRNATRSKDLYANSGWAFLQADAVGYERAMTEVMSLLTNELSNQSDVSTETEIVAASRKRGRPLGSRNREK